MYRTVLKLTKTFGDAPGPRRVADSVKSKIDKFKVHIPLLQIICNPGLRERHWEQVKGMSTLLIDIFWETAVPDPDLEIMGGGGGGAVIIKIVIIGSATGPDCHFYVVIQATPSFLVLFRKLSIGQAPGIELAKAIILRIN